MLEMLVIADDLTGAADCAAAWASQGLDAVVIRKHDADPPNAQVLAIDAATRGMTPEAAAARTAGIVTAQARRAGPRVLYKKMDSTLRGHIGSELAAALGAWRRTDPAQRSAVAILAPAFPATGRTTSGGRQYVNGAVLPQDVVAMVEAGGLRTALVGRGRLRADGLPTEGTDADVWICDAETDDDLRTIAATAASRGPNAIWAGSGGLARHAPEALGLERRPLAVPAAVTAEGPILFVVASLSRVSQEQAACLGAEPDVFSANLRRETLAGGVGSPEWSRSTASLRAALEAGHDALLTVAPCDQGDEAEDPGVAVALARFAAPHAARSGGLVLTGGDTARTVLEALDVAWLRIVGEVEPGVPLSIAGPHARPIVTKAGAFGDLDTLRRCRAAMKARA
jgi:D-threonate/D-erythronate kinase